LGNGRFCCDASLAGDGGRQPADAQPLDPARRAWAFGGLVIFLLCFTPWPVTLQ